MLTWKEFKYKNISLVLIGLIIAFLIADYPPFENLLLRLDQLSYFGALIGGLLFVSTFTFGIGAIILTSLTDHYSILGISLAAGVGAVLGDLFIFSFVKDRLVEEIKPLYQKYGGTRLEKLILNQFFSWMLPIIGAIIIASPLPDEIGVSLMGISNIKTSKFILISFALNTIGIFIILLGYKALAN